MSIRTTFELSEQAVDELDQLRARLQPHKAGAVIGRSAVNTFRDHFFDLNTRRRNKLGGRRTNFYAQAARSTQYQVEGNQVVKVGVNLARYGGTVKAKNVQFLTIPMRREAYGKRAREFNDLRFEIVSGIGPALVKADQVKLRKSRRKGETRLVPERDKKGRVVVRGGEAMYLLRRSVTRRPDPSVFPQEDALIANIEEAGEEYLSGKGDFA